MEHAHGLLWYFRDVRPTEPEVLTDEERRARLRTALLFHTPEEIEAYFQEILAEKMD